MSGDGEMEALRREVKKLLRELPDARVVFVKSLSGPSKTLQVPVCASVRDLKTAIWLQQDIPVDQQRLLFSGKQLEDRQSLSSCGINHNDLSVHLVLRLRGGMYKASSAHEDLDPLEAERQAREAQMTQQERETADLRGLLEKVAASDGDSGGGASGDGASAKRSSSEVTADDDNPAPSKRAREEEEEDEDEDYEASEYGEDESDESDESTSGEEEGQLTRKEQRGIALLDLFTGGAWREGEGAGAEQEAQSPEEDLAPPATDEEEDRMKEFERAVGQCDLARAKRLWFPGADLPDFTFNDIDQDETSKEDRRAMMLWLMQNDCVCPYDSFDLFNDSFIQLCQDNDIDPTTGYDGDWCPLHEAVDMSTDEAMGTCVLAIWERMDFYLKTVLVDNTDSLQEHPEDFFIDMYSYAQEHGFENTCRILQSLGLPRNYHPKKVVFPKKEPAPAEPAAAAAAAEPAGKLITTANTLVKGNGYTVNGIGCTVEGNDNIVNGAFCVVTGHRNIVNGSNCSVTGSDNKVRGKDCQVVVSNAGAGAEDDAPDAPQEPEEKVDYPVFNNPNLVRIGARTAFVRGKGNAIFPQPNGTTRVEAVVVPRGTRVVPVSGQGTLVRFDSLPTAKQFWRENGFGQVETKLITAMKFDEECTGEESECALCCTNKRSIGFIPCGHANACAKCVLQLVESSAQLACPWCKTATEDVMWIRF